VSEFYCHECAKQLGYLQPVDPNINLTGNDYLLSRFYKHTLPPTSNNLVGIFDQSDYNSYRDYIINTSASGSVEIDSENRVNVIWVAGKLTGFTFQNGILQIPCDSVKLVLHTDEGRIHAYPTGSAGFSSAKCKKCGRYIVT